MEADDEKVSQFMAFTGSADADRAASYLEMSGGNLETAVSLYMEHQQGGGAAATGAPALEPQQVRAPDEVQTMRLMDDNMMHQDPSYQLMNAMMEEQLAQSAFADSSAMLRDVRAAVNAAAGATDDDNDDENEETMGDEDEEYDDDGEGVIAAAAQPPGPARLSHMFVPPTHLMHTAGGFQGARAMAKDTKRWLLVNIQSDSEFSSHALNRDVWRDELVENLIREGFIFWQQVRECVLLSILILCLFLTPCLFFNDHKMNLHPEGRTYVERYQVASFPHVGIIDPRTARLMWRKEGWTQENPLTASFFAEMAMDFCSRNSFDRPPQAPRSGGARPPAKRPMHEMSEDEQLQAAMRASMQDKKTGDDNNNNDDDEIEYIADTDEEEDGKQMAQEEAPKKSANDELVSMSIGDEPTAGARVQFRMPDGKRVVRKFASSDTVKTIYAFVAVRDFLSMRYVAFDTPILTQFSHLCTFTTANKR